METEQQPPFPSKIQALGLSDIEIHFRLENLKWDLSRTASTFEIKRQNIFTGNNKDTLLSRWATSSNHSPLLLL